MKKRNKNRFTKFLSVITLTTASFSIFSQNLLTEDFSGNSVPATGWSIQGGGSSQWSLYQSNDASGQIPEMYFTGWNSFNGVTRMISPIINTSGLNGLILEWKHKILKSSNTSSVIRIETSTDGTNWSSVWSFSGTGFIGPETIVLPVNNADVGSSTFQFAFVVDGNTAPTGSFNSWRIDDVKLDVMALNDVSPVISQIASVMPDQSLIYPRATVKNWGISPVTFDVKFEIFDNGSPIYTSTKTVNNLGSVSTEYVTFDAWNTLLGNYTTKVTTLLASDAVTSNDELSVDFDVVNDVVWKNPLLEVFSSSHCGPCKAVNDHLHELLTLPENTGKYAMIKYQQNFPGDGDPYYIPSAGDRRNYYSIEGIPAFETNGSIVGGALAFEQFEFNDLLLETSQIILPDPSAVLSPDGTLTINGQVHPIGDYASGLKLHAVVIENMTTENTGDNTETEFYNVMMGMLPNSLGTAMNSLQSNVPVDYSYTINMSATFAEELSDLSLVIFVQNDNTKEIIQSKVIAIEGINALQEFADSERKFTIYPNPCNEYAYIYCKDSQSTENEGVILDATGKTIQTFTFTGNKYQIDLEGLTEGMYYVNIKNNENLSIHKLIRK